MVDPFPSAYLKLPTQAAGLGNFFELSTGQEEQAFTRHNKSTRIIEMCLLNLISLSVLLHVHV